MWRSDTNWVGLVFSFPISWVRFKSGAFTGHMFTCQATEMAITLYFENEQHEMKITQSVASSTKRSKCDSAVLYQGWVTEMPSRVVLTSARLASSP